jgi:hypothetical protein
MLHIAVDIVANDRWPRGCLFVSGAINCMPSSRSSEELLDVARRKYGEAILKRLERAIVTGDLPRDCDVDQLAAHFTVVLHGLAIASRDGLPKSELVACVELAMRAWPQN